MRKDCNITVGHNGIIFIKDIFKYIDCIFKLLMEYINNNIKYNNDENHFKNYILECFNKLNY